MKNKPLIILFSCTIIFLLVLVMAWSTDVRVQDNGWLKIMDNFVNDRTLFVRIQFLKPCKAKTLSDLALEASSKAEADKYLEIMMHVFVVNKYGMTEKEFTESRRSLKERYPDYDNIVDEYVLWPQFKCGDYRTKVFVTFYFLGDVEIETDEKVPYVGIDGKRKTEMVPGETTVVLFTIPAGATSWKIWLPK